MATDLYAISNIKTNKAEILVNKEIYLQKLKDLNLEHITVSGSGKLTGDWVYEFPYTYDKVLDREIPDEKAIELISFESPFEFSIRVYENCLEIITIYKYSFLYEGEKSDFLNEFRKNILDIISIFGGTEIIYLADNGCDKLGKYLEFWTWEGKSFKEIKINMIEKNLPFKSNYKELKLNDLNYRNITEIIFDNFEDFQ